MLGETDQHVEQAIDAQQIQEEEQRQVAGQGSASDRPRSRHGQHACEDQKQSFHAVAAGGDEDRRAFGSEDGYTPLLDRKRQQHCRQVPGRDGDGMGQWAFEIAVGRASLELVDAVEYAQVDEEEQSDAHGGLDSRDHET